MGELVITVLTAAGIAIAIGLVVTYCIALVLARKKSIDINRSNEELKALHRRSLEDRKKQKEELLRELDRFANLTKNIGKTPSKDDIQKRLDRVGNITSEQIALMQQADGPQRNALDGKHKNLLIKQIKSLEEEKIEIFHSILKDGSDPLIAVKTSEGITRMTLTEFMLHEGYALPTPETNKPTDEQLPMNAKRVGKFIVYSRPETSSLPDDSGETTH